MDMDEFDAGEQAFAEMQRVIQRMRERHPSPPPGTADTNANALSEIEQRVWEEAEESWAEFEQEFEAHQRELQPGLHGRS